MESGGESSGSLTRPPTVSTRQGVERWPSRPEYTPDHAREQLTKGSIAMPTTAATTAFDLGFRPDSYWEPADAETAILSGITGQLRREMVRDFIRGEAPAALGEISDHYLADTLSEADRASLGRINPRFMGGEYLPPYLKGEVEIARIVLQSVTMDVYSIRARRRRGPIRYRMVDEYQTEFALGRKSSQGPLTLRQLIWLIESSSFDD